MNSWEKKITCVNTKKELKGEYEIEEKLTFTPNLTFFFFLFFLSFSFLLGGGGMQLQVRCLESPVLSLYSLSEMLKLKRHSSDFLVDY